MKIRIYLGIIILLTIVSCSIQNSAMRVVPKEVGSKFVNGREFIKLEEDNLKIFTAFESLDQNYYVFDVTIKNEQNEDVLVDPALFYYKCETLALDKFDDPKPGIVKAVNPEDKLAQIDNYSESNRKSYQRNEASNAIFSVFEVAGYVAADSKEKRKEISEHSKDRAEDYRNTKNDLKDNMNNIASAKEKSMDNVLRKHTLGTGESVRGLIFFKKMYEEAPIKINFKIEDTDIFGNFEVVKHKIKKSEHEAKPSYKRW